MRQAILPYGPRRAFMPFHLRTQRFALLVAHRRCGKTVACINDLIKAAALEKKIEGRYAYIAPFLNQAKDVAWIYLKRYAQPIISKVNESDLYVELENGARVRIYGADNPDRLRGGYLDGVVLDEYADMFPGVWGEIIRPMLADREGTATFIGTPKGRNAFWELLQRAEAEGWYHTILKASETGILKQSELEAARRDMTEEQYTREFLCSFDAAILGAYYGRELLDAEREGRIRDVPYDPAVPVHTAWDLGHGHSMVVWMFQLVGTEIHIIDLFWEIGSDLPKTVAALNAKPWRNNYGKDFVPHDAKVTELGTGRTRVETLKALGRSPELIPGHTVEDGINAVKMQWRRIYIDAETCRYGLEAIRQYRADFDEKAKVFKPHPRQDWTTDFADALRYLCMAARDVMFGPAKPKEPRLLAVGPANTVRLTDLGLKGAF